MAGDLRPLKQALLDEYGSFADKRIKDIDRGDRFVVDDRKQSDHGADRQLYGWFCSMFVTVRSSTELEMWVEDTLPMSSAVDEWLHDMEVDKHANGFLFPITSENYSKLMDLGKAVLAIVRPGARYDTPAYKYVSPRTARSLRRLHRVLEQTWKN